MAGAAVSRMGYDHSLTGCDHLIRSIKQPFSGSRP